MDRNHTHHAPRAQTPGVPSFMNRAFSLIELVIVLAIVAIAAAIAVPAFTDASAGRELHAAQRMILADIDAAKLRARATSTTHTIRFYPDKERYIVAEGTDITRADILLTRDLAASPFSMDLDDTSLDAHTAIITPLGEVYPAFTLDLVNGGTTITLDIDGIADKGPVDVKVDVGDILEVKVDLGIASIKLGL
jgi:prepilin-type N-terminal cleavage/methylation domain-containing protein